MNIPSIVDATDQYESWLRKQTSVIEDHLQLKHRLMAGGFFPFLRATYYHWALGFPVVCGDIARAQSIPAIGDLHVENFGTWRDAEGRLAWGLNDYDEAYHSIPYTNDLVRLATSVFIGIADDALPLCSDTEKACRAILKGYRASIGSGGKPLVLAEEHSWLRQIAISKLRDPIRFWKRMDALQPFKDESGSLEDCLRKSMPESAPRPKLCVRIAGLGSLGRPRYVAVAEYEGGRIAREAKGIVASAHYWITDPEGPGGRDFEQIAKRSVRCHDPFLSVQDKWIIRRLAPDCSRIELIDLPREYEELKLLYSMGFECGNVHLGSSSAPEAGTSDDLPLPGRILRHLTNLPSDWLYTAATSMMKFTKRAWKDWRKYHSKESEAVQSPA